METVIIPIGRVSRPHGRRACSLDDRKPAWAPHEAEYTFRRLYHKNYTNNITTFQDTLIRTDMINEFHHLKDNIFDLSKMLKCRMDLTLISRYLLQQCFRCIWRIECRNGSRMLFSRRFPDQIRKFHLLCGNLCPIRWCPSLKWELSFLQFLRQNLKFSNAKKSTANQLTRRPTFFSLSYVERLLLSFQNPSWNHQCLLNAVLTSKNWKKNETKRFAHK